MYELKKTKFSPVSLLIIGLSLLLFGLFLTFFGWQFGICTLTCSQSIIAIFTGIAIFIGTVVLGAALIITGFAVSLRLAKSAREDIGKKEATSKTRLLNGLMWIMIGIIFIGWFFVIPMLLAPPFAYGVPVGSLIMVLLFLTAGIYWIIVGVKTIKDDSYVGGFKWIVLGVIIFVYLYPNIYDSLLGKIQTSPEPGAPKVSPVSILARSSPLLILATYFVIRGIRIIKRMKTYASFTRR